MMLNLNRLAFTTWQWWFLLEPMRIYFAQFAPHCPMSMAQTHIFTGLWLWSEMSTRVVTCISQLKQNRPNLFSGLLSIQLSETDLARSSPTSKHLLFMLMSPENNYWLRCTFNLRHLAHLLYFHAPASISEALINGLHPWFEELRVVRIDHQFLTNQFLTNPIFRLGPLDNVRFPDRDLTSRSWQHLAEFNQALEKGPIEYLPIGQRPSNCGLLSEYGKQGWDDLTRLVWGFSNIFIALEASLCSIYVYSHLHKEALILAEVLKNQPSHVRENSVGLLRTVNSNPTLASALLQRSPNVAISRSSVTLTPRQRSEALNNVQNIHTEHPGSVHWDATLTGPLTGPRPRPRQQQRSAPSIPSSIPVEFLQPPTPPPARQPRRQPRMQDPLHNIFQGLSSSRSNVLRPDLYDRPVHSTSPEQRFAWHRPVGQPSHSDEETELVVDDNSSQTRELMRTINNILTGRSRTGRTSRSQAGRPKRSHDSDGGGRGGGRGPKNRKY